MTWETLLTSTEHDSRISYGTSVMFWSFWFTWINVSRTHPTMTAKINIRPPIWQNVHRHYVCSDTKKVPKQINPNNINLRRRYSQPRTRWHLFTNLSPKQMDRRRRTWVQTEPRKTSNEYLFCLQEVSHSGMLLLRKTRRETCKVGGSMLIGNGLDTDIFWTT